MILNAPPPAMLQVLPSLVSGGVERGTLEVAEALVAAGFRAFVASAGGPLVPALEALGARHVTLPLDTKSPAGIWRNAGRLAAIARAEGIDILHARSRAPAWSALLAARRTGARFVTTYHGTYNEGFPGKRFYNSVMARGERVIAISGFIAEHIRARHGTDPARLRVIPRGVDERRFDPAKVEPSRVAALRDPATRAQLVDEEFRTRDRSAAFLARNWAGIYRLGDVPAYGPRPGSSIRPTPRTGVARPSPKGSTRPNC